MLLSTGETLAQVQDRVLGVGVSSGTLHPVVDGYLTVNVRGGLLLARGHELLFEVENITDRNYRGISWGVDAPGRGISLRYVGRF